MPTDATATSVSDLASIAYNINKANGWWEPDKSKTNLEALMLIVTEAAEAAECIREDKMETTYNENGKPEGFASELADIVIRVFDLSAHLGIDIQTIIQEKLRYNATRGYRHGGKKE